jgi:hypothetical protein
MTRLAPADLAEFAAQHFTRDLLRIELRQNYGNPADQSDLHRYLRGEPLTQTPWLDPIQAAIQAGKHWRVLHAVTQPLTSYVRYECEWGYLPGSRISQQIKIAPLAPALSRVSDLLILDEEHVLRYEYDEHDEFLGAVLVDHSSDQAAYLELARLLWDQAEDFTTWWQSHSQYHRTTRAA